MGADTGDINALKDKQFDKPEPVKNYPFIQERVDAVSIMNAKSIDDYIQLLFQVKEDVEEETGETFDTFKAVLFLKRDFNYVIRVRRRYLVLKLYKKHCNLNSTQRT